MPAKKQPLISIITICYNEPEIARTCESIVNQTFQDFEWIVVDGASTDTTLEILDKYRDRINVFISEPDNGLYDAMNKGIRRAHGQWINFMNGGDAFYSNDILARVFQDKKYNADILYGWQYFARQKKTMKFTPIVTREFLTGNPLGHQSMFIKKSLFKKYGLYDETIKIAADHEKNMCFCYNGATFEYLPFNISWFAEGGISQSPAAVNDRICQWRTMSPRYYTDEEIFKYGREYIRHFFVHPIISLTATPENICTVNQTIETLLNQTLPADKVILWLSSEMFPKKNKELPPELLHLQKHGLTIEWCKDNTGYRSLMSALKRYPNNPIVTAENNILYKPEWLEQLLISYAKNPDCIHCNRAYQVTFLYENLLPKAQWPLVNKRASVSYNNYFDAAGGVLYPPHCLHPDVMNTDLQIKLCPADENIWFWAMAVLNNTPIKIIDNANDCLEFVKDAKKSPSLFDISYDEQFANILKQYPDIWDKLEKNQRTLPAPKKHKNIVRLFGILPIISIEKL